MNDRNSDVRWQGTDPDVFWGKIAPSEHILQIHNDDRVLSERLCNFVSTGILAGDSVIVITSAEELQQLNRRLRHAGHDPFTLMLKDRYIPLEVEETLDQFMIDGWPDENLFRHMVNSMLLRSRNRHRPVRAFSELTAHLLRRGVREATVHLEHLWNKVCRAEQFSIVCAYPGDVFSNGGTQALGEICGCHSRMIEGGHPEEPPVENAG